MGKFRYFSYMYNPRIIKYASTVTNDTGCFTLILIAILFVCGCGFHTYTTF